MTKKIFFESNGRMSLKITLDSRKLPNFLRPEFYRRQCCKRRHVRALEKRNRLINALRKISEDNQRIPKGRVETAKFAIHRVMIHFNRFANDVLEHVKAHLHDYHDMAVQVI